MSSKANPFVQNRLEISETLRFDLNPFQVKQPTFHKWKRQVLHFKPTYQTMENKKRWRRRGWLPQRVLKLEAPKNREEVRIARPLSSLMDGVKTHGFKSKGWGWSSQMVSWTRPVYLAVRRPHELLVRTRRSGAVPRLAHPPRVRIGLLRAEDPISSLRSSIIRRVGRPIWRGEVPRRS